MQSLNSTRPGGSSRMRDRSASLASSIYFPRSRTHRPQEEPSSISDRLSPPGFSAQYHAGLVSRPSTAFSGTRPATASGRKSRATTATSILGHGENQSIVCAVSEARGVTPSVGVAFVNVSLGEVTLSQICDNQSYVRTIHKIQVMRPSRILFMSSACPPNRPSTLYSLVQELISEVPVEGVDRSAWSETAGLEYIQGLAFKTDIEPLRVATSGKYYATTSFSAAMRFIEQSFTISFAPHSLRIRYQPSDDTMMVDMSAFQSLEIMQNSKSPKSKDSLFGLLNRTLTPMGTRMLRSNILQPPTKVESFIMPRYDALSELLAEEEMFHEVRRALKPFHDVEKLLTKLVVITPVADVAHAEEQINWILMIKSFLESVPELYKALIPAKSPLLEKARETCAPDLINRVLSNIRRIIESDVTYSKQALDLRNHRTFAVKAGINGMLDVARRTYKELTEEIHQHVDEINEHYGFSASLKYDNGRKYWLKIKEELLADDELPDLLINVVKKNDKIECQTLDLVKLNVRLSDASNEVVMRSDAVIRDLMKSIRQVVPDLFKVSEAVALVDMIASFGHLASTQDYVRPEITDTLALMAARHPILDKSTSDTFVPNDYYATEQYCFHIVTGCNMSGKSTYIRSIALLQIMAQVGSFVPAEYASMSIIHHIFARISMDDCIESNLSTFSVEMRDMAFILRNIDHRSLAVIDELGRGTSTRDGLAIAIAMAEALIQSKASVWFATHFLDLAQVLADRPGVLNLHLASKNTMSDDGLPQVTMLYKIDPGPLKESDHYGISLARAIGLPTTMTDKAEEVAKELRDTRAANQRQSESRKVLCRRRLILNLQEALIQARDSGSEEALPGYLKKLQQEFIMRMAEFGG